MSDAYLGGTRITFVSWQGPSTLRVDFASIHGGDRLYQLYAGRTLVGGTTTTNERAIVASLTPTEWPELLTLVAISPSLRGVGIGDRLPPRAYNKAEIAVDTTGWPSDARAIEVASGTEPGGAVVPTNVVAHQIVINPEGDYVVRTTPVGPSGEWFFEVYGIDDKPVDGNKGDALALSVELLTMPRDITPQPDGTRFDVSAVAGTLTLSYDIAG